MGCRKKNEILYLEDSNGFNTPSNYFWFFISLRNNFFSRPGLYDTNTFLWVDEYNKNKIWYKGRGKNDLAEKHPMYKSQFIQTSIVDMCFPVMK